ncbi:uncharacterized protein B0T15DRAFT_506570 [Chaetomium strumarium]|uniref:Uncharacterized protein n=1 Tax=Chaetomium strumarium TaxID=1170767 RepID=A0AAJ0H0Z1_9PEZI|nr:hypothetical protein B0T15DRAFT_506570 [Chaetomium strumarium]
MSELSDSRYEKSEPGQGKTVQSFHTRPDEIRGFFAKYFADCLGLVELQSTEGILGGGLDPTLAKLSDEVVQAWADLLFERLETYYGLVLTIRGGKGFLELSWRVSLHLGGLWDFGTLGYVRQPLDPLTHQLARFAMAGLKSWELVAGGSSGRRTSYASPLTAYAIRDKLLRELLRQYVRTQSCGFWHPFSERLSLDASFVTQRKPQMEAVIGTSSFIPLTTNMLFALHIFTPADVHLLSRPFQKSSCFSLLTQLWHRQPSVVCRRRGYGWLLARPSGMDDEVVLMVKLVPDEVKIPLTSDIRFCEY